MRVITLALSLLVIGCGTGGDTPTASTEPDANQVARGEALALQSCAECHGTDLRGTDNGPSLLSVVYEPGHHSDAAFLLAVRQGVRAHHWSFGDMPPIEGLADEDVVSIAAFVRDRQEAEGFEPYP